MLSATQDSEVKQCSFVFQHQFIPTRFFMQFFNMAGHKELYLTRLKMSEQLPPSGPNKKAREKGGPTSCSEQHIATVQSPASSYHSLPLPFTSHKEFCMNFPTLQTILEHNAGFKMSNLLANVFERLKKSLIPLPSSKQQTKC